MNALAHCAEAMYAEGHNPAGDAHAVQGASLIGEWLPQVVERPHDLQARTKLLEGALHAGAALGASMLALGHALAQALGGRYGLPHGAMNALTLPQALRFNEEVAPDAVGRFRQELGVDLEELVALGDFGRLRDYGIPEGDLPEVAAATVQRAGAKANPRPASAADVERLLHNIY
jgi:maleylacetate reductase